MEGTLVISEPRSKIERLRKWYKEKIVDSKISETAENLISLATKLSAGAVKVMTQIGSVVCSAFDETKDIAPLVESIGSTASQVSNFIGDATVEGKRYVEGHLIGVDGSSKKVVAPKLDSETIIDEVNDITNNVVSIAKDLSSVESKGRTK